MKKFLFPALMLSVLLASCAGKVSKDDDNEDTDSDNTESNINIPDNAIKGDFDGDRTTEYLWVEFETDDEGFATTPITLRSDKPKFDGLVICNRGMGVDLYNLGELNNDGRDYLGAAMYSMSVWKTYAVYDFRSGKWKESLEPFSIWDNDEDITRVSRTPGKEGYVTIVTNDLSDPDNDFENQYSEVKLR